MFERKHDETNYSNTIGLTLFEAPDHVQSTSITPIRKRCRKYYSLIKSIKKAET